MRAYGPRSIAVCGCGLSAAAGGRWRTTGAARRLSWTMSPSGPASSSRVQNGLPAGYAHDPSTWATAALANRSTARPWTAPAGPAPPSALTPALACTRVLREVEPVRADVADRAQGPALRRLDAPVVVGVEEQPVLPVTAVHERHRSEVAAPDQGAGVLQHRIEADVERHGVDQSAGLRRADEVRRLGRRHRQRLLAHDVLPGGERGPRRGIVERVRSRDVHDVQLGVLDQAPVVAVRPGDEERRRLALRGGLGAPRQRDNLDEAEPAERFDVRRADEPGADHADTDRETAGDIKI